MIRIASTIAAAAFLASPALAGNYSGTPVAPSTQRIIARDIVWNCGPAACQGATDTSRPAVLCQSLAKRAGRLSSFLANGRAFTPDDLQRCNSVAKKADAPALANAR